MTISTTKGENMADLGTFEDRKITRTTIAMRNAGDGLSQAMAVDPQLLHQGDTVYVVVECKVGPVSFDPIKDSETECVRKHVLRAGAATIVDADLVREAVEAQTAKIIEAKEKELGIQQLPTDAKLLKDHNKGTHRVPYIGCSLCFPDAAAPEKKPAGTTTGESKPTKAPPKKSAPPKSKPAPKADAPKAADADAPK